MNKLPAMIGAAAASAFMSCAYAEDAYVASTSDPTIPYKIDTGYHAGPNTRIDADFDGVPVSCTVENLPQSLMIFIQ